jgi:cytoskeletal protein CcmA (bactofilin family)
MRHILVGMALGIFFVLPSFAEAQVVKRTGATVSIASEEIVEGNFYAAGNTVSVTGTIDGDAHIMGGTVTVNGDVKKDLFVVGGTVTITGAVGEDIRIVAGEAVIDGTIQGNVTVFGGRLKVLSSATIAGDIMMYGGEATIEGEVTGSVFGGYSILRIDGIVAGDVEVAAESFALGKRTQVAGNVTYVSGGEVLRASEAVVGGTIVRNDQIGGNDQDGIFSYRGQLMVTMITLFTVLVMYLVARKKLDRILVVLFEHPHALLRLMFVGLLVLFAPVGIMILLATVLGSMLGVMSLFVYLLLLVCAIPLMLVLLAGIVARIQQAPRLSLVHMMSGAVLFLVLLLIPVIGIYLLFGIYVLALGVVSTMLYRGVIAP